MRISTKAILAVVCLSGVFGCHQSEKVQLPANLEKVRAAQQASGDIERIKAAEFLFKNMATAHSMEGPSLDSYYQQLADFYKCPGADMWSLYAFEDSLFATKQYFPDLVRKNDLSTISAEYLISRIDNAFDVRKLPFAADLSFEDFCEYLLPYRIGDEQLEYWWQDYPNAIGSHLNDLIGKEGVTLEEFCAAINTIIAEQHRNYTNYPSSKPSPKPSSLLSILGGTCEDYLALTMYICRSYGIPIAKDFTPQWSNHSKGHSWSAIIQGDSTYHYMIGEPLYLAREKPFTFKAVKVYRQKPSGLADVTESYMDVIDLKIPRLYPEANGKNLVLCCFNDKDWTPVASARSHSRKGIFRNVGFPAVFLVQYRSDDGSFKPAQYPVFVDSCGKTRLLKPDKSHLRQVRLTRKFMDVRAMQFVDSLRDGHFELSSRPDFRDAMVVEIPDSIGFNFQTARINGKFRYARYVPKVGGTGNIAEIELYGRDGERLSGEIIGTYKCSDTFHPMTNAFDSDVLTYAVCKKTQTDAWLGLDLGKETYIKQLSYLPRSDDNFIREGEEYELCYWDGAWIPMGRKIGSRRTQELIYDNVPDNALLLLHNYTRGKEERIFLYENGRQIWW